MTQLKYTNQDRFCGKRDAIEFPAGDWDLSELYTKGSITLRQRYDHRFNLYGDYDINGQLDVGDIDRLSVSVRGGKDPSYDISLDRALDADDRVAWVHEIKGTWFGDANLDGKCNSGDLVTVFTAGEYEDAIEDNSGWAEGDWDGDGDFTSGDLVVAFQDGGYEQGPRPALAAIAEPTGIGMMTITFVLVAVSSTRRRKRRF